MRGTGSPERRPVRLRRGWRFRKGLILERVISAELFVSSDDVLDLAITFRYRGADPLVIVLVFPYPRIGCRPNRWVVGRDLIEAGLDRWSGEGDVQVFRATSTETVVEMTGRGGHAKVVFETKELRRFLADSYRIVPVGNETRYLDVDGCIAKLLKNT